MAFTLREFHEGLLELYQEWQELAARKDGVNSIRLPDFEAAIEQHRDFLHNLKHTLQQIVDGNTFSTPGHRAHLKLAIDRLASSAPLRLCASAVTPP